MEVLNIFLPRSLQTYWQLTSYFPFSKIWKIWKFYFQLQYLPCKHSVSLLLSKADSSAHVLDPSPLAISKIMWMSSLSPDCHLPFLYWILPICTQLCSHTFHLLKYILPSLYILHWLHPILCSPSQQNVYERLCLLSHFLFSHQLTPVGLPLSISQPELLWDYGHK